MTTHNKIIPPTVYDSRPHVYAYVVAGPPEAPATRSAYEPHKTQSMSREMMHRIIFDNACVACLRADAAASLPLPIADAPRRQAPADAAAPRLEPLDLRSLPPLGVEILATAFCADCREKPLVQHTVLANLTQPPPEAAEEPLPAEAEQALCLEDALSALSKKARSLARRAFKKYGDVLGGCGYCSAGVNVVAGPGGRAEQLACESCCTAVGHRHRCRCGAPRYVSPTLHLPALCKACHHARVAGGR